MEVTKRGYCAEPHEGQNMALTRTVVPQVVHIVVNHTVVVMISIQVVQVLCVSMVTIWLYV